MLQKAILRRFLQQNAVADISEEMVMSLLAVLPPDAPASRVNLPGNRRACRRARRLVIEDC